MRIAAYAERGSTVRRLGQIANGHIVPFAFGDDLVRLLARGDGALEAAAKTAQRAAHRSLEEVRLLAPVHRPGKILAIGLNYEDHRAESPLRAELPPYAEGFVKLASSITDPEERIIAWPEVTQLDYEVELAAIIGRTAHNVSPEEALGHVAGYTVANDVSARDWQRSERSRGRSPLLGKNFPSFCPLGPWLVTRDEIPDPQTLSLQLRVNGEVRQSGSTADMIFTLASAIAHWSKLRLDPGDVILTGTPSGVAWARKPDPAPYFLKVGDVVEAEIEGIGTLRNRVTAP